MLSKTLLLASALATSITAARTTSALNPPFEGARLIKTSAESSGTWMNESSILSLVQKNLGFADITNTMALEEARITNKGVRKSAATYPSGAEHDDEALPLTAQVSQTNLKNNLNEMAAFQNRYYKSSTYGPQSAAWMYTAVQEAAAANSAITVSQFKHSYSQPSVIAVIPGTSDATVIASAHYDSINGNNPSTGRAPGADDNASGIIAILEALRILAEDGFAPENTLEFHFYSGEEGGLLGSRDVVQSYVDDDRNVIAMMNQDMAGYSPNKVIAVYTDYVSTGLTNYISTLVPTYSKLPVSHDVCGYSCSDHSSGYDAGWEVAYVCDENIEDSSPYIHTAQDTVSTVDIAHVAEHAKFTIGFMVEASYL